MTQAICLGVLIDKIKGTVLIPPEQNVCRMVDVWASKNHCTRNDLQSLLGHLLYVHKCVKPVFCQSYAGRVVSCK